MNDNKINEIKECVKNFCYNSYDNLINNLSNTNLNLTSKQLKIITESFNFLILNINSEIDVISKSQN